MRNLALLGLGYVLSQTTCVTKTLKENTAAIEARDYSEEVAYCAEFARETAPNQGLHPEDSIFQEHLTRLLENTALQCRTIHQTTGEYPQVDTEHCAELAREANPVRSLDINDPEFQKQLEQLVENTSAWAKQCVETHQTTGEYPPVVLTSPSSAHSQNAVHQDQ